MMIVQYLLDADETVTIPGVEAPRTDFADPVAPVALALEQERTVTEQIVALAKLAREEGDLVGEQFLHWFLEEQREEVSSMSALLRVVERGKGNMLLVEEYLAARERRRGWARGQGARRGRRRLVAGRRPAYPRFVSGRSGRDVSSTRGRTSEPPQTASIGRRRVLARPLQRLGRERRRDRADRPRRRPASRAAAAGSGQGGETGIGAPSAVGRFVEAAKKVEADWDDARRPPKAREGVRAAPRTPSCKGRACRRRRSR